MSRLQQACTVAGTLWVGMHLWHGLSFSERHAVPALNLAAVVLAATVTAWAATPLASGREGLSAFRGGVLATLGVSVALLVIPFLDAAGVRSYANWPAGGLGPLIAALVMRRRGRHAAVLAGMLCLVIICVVTITADGLDPVWSISLCIPPLLWLGASALVRRVFDRTALTLRMYATAEQDARQRTHAALTREAWAAERRASLQDEAVPVLRQLVSDPEVSGHLRHACADLEDRLRDDLRARWILDADMRRLLGAARRAGTQVTVLDDRAAPAEDEVAQATRTVIALVLPALHGARVTFRIAANEDVLTVVAEGEQSMLREPAQQLREHVGMEVDVDDGILFGSLGPIVGAQRGEILR